MGIGQLPGEDSRSIRRMRSESISAIRLGERATWHHLLATSASSSRNRPDVRTLIADDRVTTSLYARRTFSDTIRRNNLVITIGCDGAGEGNRTLV
jgi:hypothetical protein